ncbi:hypothetical protein BH24CHL4_BH24CHL4_01010 [soil metagenome]
MVGGRGLFTEPFRVKEVMPMSSHGSLGVTVEAVSF